MASLSQEKFKTQVPVSTKQMHTSLFKSSPSFPLKNTLAPSFWKSWNLHNSYCFEYWNVVVPSYINDLFQPLSMGIILRTFLDTYCVCVVPTQHTTLHYQAWESYVKSNKILLFIKVYFLVLPIFSVYAHTHTHTHTHAHTHTHTCMHTHVHTYTQIYIYIYIYIV